VTARLHVLLGQGGVGKTTLSASYALALAAGGRRVGLLGVDPSGRLRTALGLADLPERPVQVCDGLQAALLRPDQSLRRWAMEELGPEGEELLGNPFFVALADRLGTAIDALAALRIAEWPEKDPHLEHLVVDTAPGLHGLEFLVRPERLVAFLSGSLLGWLSRALAPGPAGRRVLRGLSRIAGLTVLDRLAEFSLRVRQMAPRMISRLDAARWWLRSPLTELLLVCVPRPDAARGVTMLAQELKQLRFTPKAVVLNRALPGDVLDGAPDRDDPVARYAGSLLRIQREVADALRPDFPVAPVPLSAGLDEAGDARLDTLRTLGVALIGELAKLGG